MFFGLLGHRRGEAETQRETRGAAGPAPPGVSAHQRAAAAGTAGTAALPHLLKGSQCLLVFHLGGDTGRRERQGAGRPGDAVPGGQKDGEGQRGG